LPHHLEACVLEQPRHPLAKQKRILGQHDSKSRTAHAAESTLLQA
jgi:hypothetical protein